METKLMSSAVFLWGSFHINHGKSNQKLSPHLKACDVESQTEKTLTGLNHSEFASFFHPFSF